MVLLLLSHIDTPETLNLIVEKRTLIKQTKNSLYITYSLHSHSCNQNEEVLSHVLLNTKLNICKKSIRHFS
eukprot:UN20181